MKQDVDATFLTVVALPLIRIGRLVMMKIVCVPGEPDPSPGHAHHDHLFVVHNAIALSVHHNIGHGFIAHHAVLLRPILSLFERDFSLVDFENEATHRVIAGTFNIDGDDFTHHIFLSLTVCVLFLLHQHFCGGHLISLDLRGF